jgi:hypothetical protein
VRPAQDAPPGLDRMKGSQCGSGTPSGPPPIGRCSASGRRVRAHFSSDARLPSSEVYLTAAHRGSSAPCKGFGHMR